MKGYPSPLKGLQWRKRSGHDQSVLFVAREDLLKDLILSLPLGKFWGIFNLTVITCDVTHFRYHPKLHCESKACAQSKQCSQQFVQRESFSMPIYRHLPYKDTNFSKPYKIRARFVQDCKSRIIVQAVNYKYVYVFKFVWLNCFMRAHML